MSVRSLSLALKSLWFKKNPSTALSKTTTLSSSSVSSAVMISRNSRTNSGPIKFSGGLSNVTRQYLGEDRVSLICAIFAVASTTAYRSNTIGIPYCDTGVSASGPNPAAWQRLVGYQASGPDQFAAPSPAARQMKVVDPLDRL